MKLEQVVKGFDFNSFGKRSDGVNKNKLRSFELFRNNQKDIDIITYDELYERAKFIVHNNQLQNE